MIMKFIYDRTQEDVDRVNELNEKYITGTISDEEKTEWLSDLKGAFNVSDLNRIEGNIDQIATYIKEEVASFRRDLVITKAWEETDIPRASDFARIRNNIMLIREVWYTIPDTPVTPDTPYNYFEKINDIEKILKRLYDAYVATTRSYDYCGEFYAGEEVAYI